MDVFELQGARAYLIEQFRKELLGPGSEISYPDAEHEIITDLPEVRYSVGILYPQRNPIGLDNDVSDNFCAGRKFGFDRDTYRSDKSIVDK